MFDQEHAPMEQAPEYEMHMAHCTKCGKAWPAVLGMGALRCPDCESMSYYEKKPINQRGG